MPEEYQTIVEIIDYELYYEDNTLNIERICDKLLEKFDQMNEQSIPIMSR